MNRWRGSTMREIEAAVVAGVPVDDVNFAEAVDLIGSFVEEGRSTGRTFQVATVNVDFVVNASKEAAVMEILQRADLCLADGMPILWHARLSGSRLRERVAGADLVPTLADLSRDGLEDRAVRVGRGSRRSRRKHPARTVPAHRSWGSAGR